jgi:hypothetical protein
MKTSRSLLTINSLSIIVFIGLLSIYGQKAVGNVRGSLFDRQDAVIPGTDITVQNNSFRTTVKTDSDGQFFVNLPPGYYTISTGQNHWWAVRRSNFRITGNETLVINLNPTIRILSVSLVASDTAIKDVAQYNYTPKYDEFLPLRGSPLNLVVEYRKRSQKNPIITYREAKLTYDALTIIADVLRFDSKSLELEAIGNVTVDRNGVREKTPKIRMKIEVAGD